MSEQRPDDLFERRLGDAIEMAAGVHVDDVRKGATETPYISHPLAVASLVLEDGGSEDEVLAAVLHDVVEHGGRAWLPKIEERFSESVATIVDKLSDPEGEPREVREGHKFQILRGCDAATARVALADKLHNLRCMERDYRQLGDAFFEDFSLGKSGKMSYFRRIHDVFQDRKVRKLGPETWLLDEFERTFDRLSSLSDR